MKILRSTLLFLAALSAAAISSAQDELTVESPDGTIRLIVKTKDFLEIAVMADSSMLLDFSRHSLSIEDEEVLGLDPRVKKKIPEQADRVFRPVVAEKFNAVHDHYNGLTLRMKGDYSVHFRVYDNGVA